MVYVVSRSGRLSERICRQVMSVDPERRARIELADTARRRLASGVEAVLGDRFVQPTGQKADVYADGIVVSGFTLFDRFDGEGAEREPFVNSTFNARRRVGLMALRRLADSSESVGSMAGYSGSRADAGVAGRLQLAIDTVMDDPEGWPIGLRDWVESLDRSGQTAIVSATITWCAAALRLVGTDPRIVWNNPQYPNGWTVPGRLVRLTANVDASIGTPGRGEKLFVISDAEPSPLDRVRAGYVALVRAVGIGCAPERVTAGAPSRGSMTRFDVTEDLLDLAVDQVIQAVALAAASRSLNSKSGQ